MSKSTISTFKLFELFPDEHSAREYLESRLWPDGARCPQCKSGDRLTKRTGGFYRCNACQGGFMTLSINRALLIELRLIFFGLPTTLIVVAALEALIWGK